MALWRPAQREPDPLHCGIYDYLRNRAPQVYLDGVSSVRALGRTSVVLSDGHPLTLELIITPVGASAMSGRDAIVFAVSGHAADREAGYEVDGRVIIDRETLAFLLIEATPSRINLRK